MKVRGFFPLKTVRRTKIERILDKWRIPHYDNIKQKSVRQSPGGKKND